uniref:Fucosyltransferase n=2 Tax=Panagrolaimus sp. JU765 TaxID=591449 RepID=A0AC34RSQ9_9BILA
MVVKPTKIKCFVLIVIVFCFWKIHKIRLIRRGYPKDEFRTNWIGEQPKNGPMKTILLWTNYYSVPWLPRIGDFGSNKICPNLCTFTDDKSKLDESSAVLFHSAADNLDLNDLPKHRQFSQFYVFFNQEPPPKSGWRDRPDLWKYFPDNFFNLTMTYRQDSDIYHPYDRFVPISDANQPSFSWEHVKEVVHRKDKMALQFVGNCYSESKREPIIREMASYISVDQFGYCASKKCDKSCENDILPEYYFFLAFENNICDEYVTEKFWRIKKLIVPIVLRRKLVPESVAPPNSFIAVDDFDSIENLTTFLHFVSKNETEYLKFFEWTKKFQNTNSDDNLSFCDLCHKLHNNSAPRKYYKRMDKWYDPDGICVVYRLNGWLEVGHIWPKTVAFIVFLILFVLILIFFIFKKFKLKLF